VLQTTSPQIQAKLEKAIMRYQLIDSHQVGTKIDELGSSYDWLGSLNDLMETVMLPSKSQFPMGSTG
jgi:hypothetical protein